MNAVLSPPTVSRLWNDTVCDPAATVNTAVLYPWYDVPVGVNVPTAAPSTSTWKSCRDVPLLPRCAASKVSTYDPAAQLFVAWLTVAPLPWRKATCAPCGALGLPEVNP